MDIGAKSNGNIENFMDMRGNRAKPVQIRHSGNVHRYATHTYYIMGAFSDLHASASCPDNADIYRSMVELEIKSTFQFQSNRWLGDLAPHLLTQDMLDRLAASKAAAMLREQAEARLPKHLLFTKGWPTSRPTHDEAVLIGEVRKEVGATLGLKVRFTEAEEILSHYAALMELSKNKVAKKSRKKTGVKHSYKSA